LTAAAVAERISKVVHVKPVQQIPRFAMPPRPPDWPENFPDLTIPERTDVPADPARPLFPSDQVTWKVGDRVLAPWEPQFLYVGRISRLDGGKALIEFEDGDAGWVQLDQIRQLAIVRGAKVFSRRRMGPTFEPAEVLEVNGDSIHVGFHDGSSEWTRIAALRIPCEARGPVATPTKVASHLAFLKKLKSGDRVWAPWDRSALFAGTVEEIGDNEAHIHFDDGDQGWVLLNQLIPLQLNPGVPVLVRRKVGSQFQVGKVIRMDGERIYLRYDDGNEEWTSPISVVIPCQPIGPSARPTKVANRAGRSWGWIIFLVAMIAYMLIRFAAR
jgi:hypothetical protein